MRQLERELAAMTRERDKALADKAVLVEALEYYTHDMAGGITAEALRKVGEL